MKFRHLLQVTRGLLGWTGFVLLVIMALYVSLGRIVVTNLGDYRQEITARVSSYLQVDVTIGNLTGDWQGINPGIDISDITISEGESHPGTHVGNLRIEIDSLASIVEGDLVIRQMEVSDLKSEIKFQDDGRFKVAGLPLTDKKGEPSTLVSLLVHTQHLKISGVEAEVKTELGRYSLFQKTDYPLEVISDKELKTLSLQLEYKHQDDADSVVTYGSLELVGEYSGDPREFDDFYARAWLHVTPTSIQEFLPALNYKGINLDTFTLAGDCWLEFNRGRFDIIADFDVPVLTAKSPLSGVSGLNDMTGIVRITGTSVNVWQASVQGLKFSFEGRNWNPIDIAAVAYRTVNNNNLLVRFSSLDLERLAELVTGLGKDLIPERTMTMLQAMQPKGVLAGTYLYFRPGSEQPDFRIISQLKSGRIQAYRGAPAISNLNSVFSINPQQAWIDIHNSVFDIEFASISDEVWNFDSAGGRLNIDYKQGILSMGSDLLKIRKGDMVVSGKFQLNLTHDRRMQTWSLLLGIENGDISRKSLYLPDNLSEELRAWLDSGLVSGHLKNAGLLFHGSLSKDAEPIEKVYELYFDVEHTTLDYHPDWPRLQNIDALVNVGNWGVSSSAARATIFGSQLSTDLSMPFDAIGGTSFVYVNGTLNGSAADGIKFINTTPVADMVNHLSSDWTVKGDITTDLDLKIPVNYSLNKDGKPRYNFDGEIDTRMNDVSLYMPVYDLNVSNLSTNLKYSVSSGLNTEQFSANMLGYPVRGSIATSFKDEVDRNNGRVLINFSGKTSVEELKNWSELTVLVFASGTFDYSATLTTSFGKGASDSYLIADTDLLGVEIRLPERLGKLAENRVAVKYKSIFGDDGMKVMVDYADDFNAAMVIRNAAIERGSFVFGLDRARVPDSPGVIVDGNLTQMDLNEWLRVQDQFTLEFEKSARKSLVDEFKSVVRRIKLDVGVLDTEDFSLHEVALDINRIPRAWDIHLTNAVLSGTSTVYDDENEPIDVKLDYLRLTSESGVSDLEDPLEKLTVHDLAPMQVQIDEFIFSDEDYGSWKFKLEPGDNDIRISDLYASVKGLEIGNAEQGGGIIEWLFDGIHQSTTFDGVVWTKDIANAAKKWGYAPSIEGDSFEFDAKLSWFGSPVMLTEKSVRGSIKVRSKRGRFVQATGGGAVKVLGVFDFAALARRLKFDFSDVVTDGYEFDKVKGDWWIENGKIRIMSPPSLTVEGSGSSFTVGGVMDLVTSELEGDMIVTLPVSRNLPWYSALLASPAVGATVYLAQKVFKHQINQLSSAKYKVTGTVDEPNIVFVNIFDDSVKKEEKPEEKSESDKKESQPVQVSP